MLPRYPAKCLFLDRFYFHAVLLSLWLSRTWENGWGGRLEENKLEKLRRRPYVNMRGMRNRWKQTGIREENQTGDTWGKSEGPETRGELHFKMKQEVTRQNLIMVWHIQGRDRNPLRKETQSFILVLKSWTHSVWVAEHAGALRGTSHWRPTWQSPQLHLPVNQSDQLVS